MRAWTLGSGSRGNAVLLECEGTRVLVDNGYPARVLARRLAGIGVAPESISAVIVTHEHIDHSSGVAVAQRRWHWHVFGSAGTLGRIRGLNRERTTAVQPHSPWCIGNGSFELVRISHDAVAPTAVVATALSSGFRTGVAHDLGAPNEMLRRAFADLDLLLLESNHDETMLRNGPYPVFLQQRILGRNGHLSNRQSAAFVRELATEQLTALVLLHLSEVNNTPGHALAAAKNGLRGGRARCTVAAAGQDAPAGPFGDVKRAAMQLTLGI